MKSINPFKSVILTSYDIVKAHGGEIKVERKVDDGNPDKFGIADPGLFGEGNSDKFGKRAGTKFNVI